MSSKMTKMKPFVNLRNIGLVVFALILLALKVHFDPTDGVVTKEFLLYVTTPMIVVLIGHWLRKALFPYIYMGELYDKAKQSSIGAGLTFIGICILIFAIYGLFGPAARAQDVKSYIPPQAKQHFPTINRELATLWPNHPKKLQSLV